MKKPLKSYYNVTPCANVPFYHQKCHLRCSRDVIWCFRAKNCQKLPFLPPERTPTAESKNFNIQKRLTRTPQKDCIWWVIILPEYILIFSL